MTPQEAKTEYGATHYLEGRSGAVLMYYKRHKLNLWSDHPPVWCYLDYSGSWSRSEIKDPSKLTQID